MLFARNYIYSRKLKINDHEIKGLLGNQSWSNWLGAKMDVAISRAFITNDGRIDRRLDDLKPRSGNRRGQDRLGYEISAIVEFHLYARISGTVFSAFNPTTTSSILSRASRSTSHGIARLRETERKRDNDLQITAVISVRRSLALSIWSGGQTSKPCERCGPVYRVHRCG